MKQFKTILKFELNNLLGNKVFKGVTISIVVLMAIVMFFPRIKDMIVGNDEGETEQTRDSVMAVSADESYASSVQQLFEEYFPGYEVKLVSGEDDPVGGYGKGVRRVFDLYKKAGIKDLNIKLYENDRHEILNETDRQNIYRDILDWMDHRSLS